MQFATICILIEALFQFLDAKKSNANRLRCCHKIRLQTPWYKNFRGTIEQLDTQRFVCNGEVAIINNETIEITELPIRSWTQTYKETVLVPMMDGNDKQPAVIT